MKGVSQICSRRNACELHFGIVADLSRRAALLPIAVSALSAREKYDPTLLTGTFPNGRLWKKLDDSTKVLVVYAIRSGISALSSALDELEGPIQSKAHKAALDFFRASNTTVGELSQEISLLYEEPASAAIPIANMYFLAGAIFRGLSAAEVQKELGVFRSAAQSLPEDDR